MALFLGVPDALSTPDAFDNHCGMEHRTAVLLLALFYGVEDHIPLILLSPLYHPRFEVDLFICESVDIDQFAYDMLFQEFLTCIVSVVKIESSYKCFKRIATHIVIMPMVYPTTRLYLVIEPHFLGKPV